jgi:hypothetical protein
MGSLMNKSNGIGKGRGFEREKKWKRDVLRMERLKWRWKTDIKILQPDTHLQVGFGGQGDRIESQWENLE